MTKISKGDFIEIEYTGRVKGDNSVFDTTDEKTAKENEIHGHDFSPKIICIGEEHVLPGIDKELEGKETGKDYEIDVKPEDGFGNKKTELLQMIPTNKFKQQNIQPMPGMQINVDGMVGTVKTVSGGRTMIDFNHPLSGKGLSYKIKVNRKVEDDKEKLNGFLKLSMGTDKITAEIKEGKAEVKFNQELPKEAKDELSKKIKELIPGIKDVEFSTVKEEKNK